MSNKYPDNWDEIATKIRQRDSYMCQNCGKTGGPRGNAELHVHHVQPISRGGSHHPNSLMILCWRCHNSQHAHHVPSAKQRKQKRNRKKKRRRERRTRDEITASRSEMSEKTSELHSMVAPTPSQSKQEASSEQREDGNSVTSKQWLKKRKRKDTRDRSQIIAFISGFFLFFAYNSLFVSNGYTILFNVSPLTSLVIMFVPPSIGAGIIFLIHFHIISDPPELE
jgi:hypothetical protein